MKVDELALDDVTEFDVALVDDEPGLVGAAGVGGRGWKLGRGVRVDQREEQHAQEGSGGAAKYGWGAEASVHVEVPVIEWVPVIERTARGVAAG